MKNYIDTRWSADPGRAYYGAGQYCESIWPVVDRWHDKPQQCQPQGGNPIFPLTGTKRQGEALMQWSPHNPALSITFDNRRKLPNLDPQGAFVAKALPSFGDLWESNLHKRLVVQQGGSPGYYRNIQASRGNGAWASFTSTVGRPSLSPDSDIADRITPLAAGWRYADAAGHTWEVYDSAGALKTVASARGGNLTYAYSDGTTPTGVAPSSGLLIKVQDTFGRAVHFEYEQAAGDPTPRVVRAIDPDGHTILVTYDTAGNLSELRWPDGSARRFLYEHTAMPWALTGIVDENETRHSSYAYDSEGRAVSTEYAGGVNRHSVRYSSPPRWVTTETFDGANFMFWRDHSWQAPQGTVMETPNGAAIGFGATSVNGMPRATTRSQPAGAGCDASTSTSIYDANGNVISRVDFNGIKSCHAYDLNRNLEVMRVEGLSADADCEVALRDGSALAVGARRVTTQWHPDWRLPTAVAEPKKIITQVYNGQPDPFNGNAAAACAPASATLPDGKPLAVLCKRVEQPTVDVNGHRGFSIDAAPATPADPFFSSVGVLLHLDGTHGSTAIADKSPDGRTWSAVGGAVLSTQQSRFGKSSLAPGSGAIVTAPSSHLLFGDGDFTVEAWVYKTGSPREAAIVALWAVDQCSWFMGSNASNQLSFYSSSTGCGSANWPAAGTIPLNAWTHVAVSRSGSRLLFFINGAQVGTATISGPVFVPSGTNATVGAWIRTAPVDPWPGFIDEVRITKGVARYTAAFIVPVSPFSDTPEGSPALPSAVDQTAPPRTWSYTYNEYGQVLTTRDPLNNQTTYAYYSDTTDEHTRGDLQSVTNASGQVVRYTSYDRSGRVLQSIDTNGAVADTTYTPRGWVKTTTVTPVGAAPQVTVYDYDGVGQLKKATLSDGTVLEYSYDAAHRLTGVKDAAGNSVTYTLDNTGNRTGEQLKDPSGVLARSMNRVFDALNRVQGTTGGAQ